MEMHVFSSRGGQVTWQWVALCIQMRFRLCLPTNNYDPEKEDLSHPLSSLKRNQDGRTQGERSLPPFQVKAFPPRVASGGGEHSPSPEGAPFIPAVHTLSLHCQASGLIMLRFRRLCVKCLEWNISEGITVGNTRGIMYTLPGIIAYVHQDLLSPFSIKMQNLVIRYVTQNLTDGDVALRSVWS